MMIKRSKPAQQEDSVTIGGGSAVVDVDTVDASKLGMKQGQLAPTNLTQKLQMPEPQRMADQPAMASAAPTPPSVAAPAAQPAPAPAAAPRKKQQVAQIEGEMPVAEKKQARKLKY